MTWYRGYQSRGGAWQAEWQLAKYLHCDSRVKNRNWIGEKNWEHATFETNCVHLAAAKSVWIGAKTDKWYLGPVVRKSWYTSHLYILASDWLRQVIKAFSLAEKCHHHLLGIKLEVWLFCRCFFGLGVVTNVFIIVICHGHIQNLHKMTKPSPDPSRNEGRGAPSVFCHPCQKTLMQSLKNLHIFPVLARLQTIWWVNGKLWRPWVTASGEI